MRSMSAALGFWLLLALYSSGAMAAEELQFPYKAYIAADEAYVRSGPGLTYYPTDKLAKGTEVEVYRHEPGGWCSIRPPKGSFTWVAGRFVQAQDDHLGVITEQGAAARVGTRLSDAREVCHVRLDKGEVVEILEAPPAGVSEWRAWYKISPPSGEFRWVAARDLDADRPQDRRRRHDAPDDGFVAKGASDGFVAKGTSGKDVPERPAAEPEDRAAPKELPADAQNLSPLEFKAELDRIELALSMMIVEEPTVWSFDALRVRADSLLGRARSAVERGQARLLLSKIDRFEDIKIRYHTILAQREEGKESGRFLGGLRRTMREAREYVDTQSDQYDGQGVLQPVRSDKPGDPRYALLDGNGKVRCYVSPAPGVNLHSYVGRPIGVTGTRGYLADQKAQYIMARHVIPLVSGGTVLR